MAETAIARLFTHGRSQAVRLPKEFRLPGDRVRVRHVGDGVLLEPIASDVEAWFAELDRFADVPRTGVKVHIEGQQEGQQAHEPTCHGRGA